LFPDDARGVPDALKYPREPAHCGYARRERRRLMRLPQPPHPDCQSAGAGEFRQRQPPRFIM
jgi:hypothetical protein